MQVRAGVYFFGCSEHFSQTIVAPIRGFLVRKTSWPHDSSAHFTFGFIGDTPVLTTVRSGQDRPAPAGIRLLFAIVAPFHELLHVVKAFGYLRQRAPGVGFLLGFVRPGIRFDQGVQFIPDQGGNGRRFQGV